jgi:hypothetical protein
MFDEKNKQKTNKNKQKTNKKQTKKNKKKTKKKEKKKVRSYFSQSVRVITKYNDGTSM